MQIVINISEKHYKMVRDGLAYKSGQVLSDAFKNATVLPESHGRLIDADKLKIDNPLHLSLDIPYVAEDTVEEIIDHAPTVLEGSDKGVQ